MKIGIVSRIDMEEAIDLTKKIISMLSSHDVFLDDGLLSHIDGKPIDKVDVILVVGGDGTILRTCKDYGATPLLTVNMGTYGFLCELKIDEIAKIPSILEDYVVEEREKLSVFHKGRHLGNVLNEVVVRSTSPIKMDHLQVEVDDEKYEVIGDGVIVATPTGSTAYSLSAGGSIVHHQAQVFIITPISPLFRKAHPYVVPNRYEVGITNMGKECYIILDGQPIETLRPDESIKIIKSTEIARFIRRKMR
ncbi:MAG: NAD(+)/NADH kinase [Candidatus Methanofastidiosia archaeon]